MSLATFSSCCCCCSCYPFCSKGNSRRRRRSSSSSWRSGSSPKQGSKVLFPGAPPCVCRGRRIFKVWLRRSVEELMNQQLDDVWKLRFPEKMWHFVVFSPSGPSDSAMSLPSGRCADRETFSVSLAKTPRVAGGEERLFPKI